MKLHIPNMEAILKLTPAELGYMAGFFDGEGNITVYIQKGRNLANFKVSAAQNRPKVLFWFHEIWGGSLHVINRDTPKYQELHGNITANGYEWVSHGQMGPQIFLNFMLPYLRVKADEAKEALFVMNNREKLTPDEVQTSINNIRLLRKTEGK